MATNPTDKTDIDEFVLYLKAARVCKYMQYAEKRYPDDVGKRRRYAAEIAYWHQFERLPEWRTVVERVEPAPGGTIFYCYEYEH